MYCVQNLLSLCELEDKTHLYVSRVSFKENLEYILDS